MSGAVEPLLVTYNDKGQIEGVKYDRIGVVLINVVKEQQTQIESQQRQIRSQQRQIETQQRQLDALKKILCEVKWEAEICSEKE
jgi:type III secretory pathway lipoprotein EscJ